MRSLCAATLLLTAFTMAMVDSAHAQQPFQLPAAAPQGEVLFVLEDAPTQRFMDRNDVVGVQLIAREAVTVVARHEGRVRVFVKGSFGWVDEALLSTEPPAMPELAPGELPPLLPPG